MTKPSKARADQLLVERGLADSRTRAQALVMAGQVYSGTRRIDRRRSGTKLAVGAQRAAQFSRPVATKCGTPPKAGAAAAYFLFDIEKSDS